MIHFQNSQTRAITPLVQLDSNFIPDVYYTADVKTTIDYLVASTDDEVGWFGLVDELVTGDYLVTEILIPDQTVSRATVDIDADAVTKLVMELMDRGVDPGKLRYHGHSHVKMQVQPSGTDQEHLEEYMENCDWFIRGIYNKMNQSKVDVFDKRQSCVYQCVNTGVYELLRDDAFYDTLDVIIAGRVKKHVYKYKGVQTGKQLGPVQTLSGGALYQKGYTPFHNIDFDDDDDDIVSLDELGRRYLHNQLLSDPFYTGKP